MKQNDRITVFITLNVRLECERAFEEAVICWLPRLVAYKANLKAQALRTFSGNRSHAAVLTFRNPHESQAFQRSTEYMSFLADIRPYLETNPQFETICGLEGWFTPPTTEIRQVPARWKMALVTWIGVCCTVYTVTLLLTPATQYWPWILRFITVNAGVVAGLTWLVMPVLNRLFRAWLFPTPSKTF